MYVVVDSGIEGSDVVQLAGLVSSKGHFGDIRESTGTPSFQFCIFFFHSHNDTKLSPIEPSLQSFCHLARPR